MRNLFIFIFLHIIFCSNASFAQQKQQPIKSIEELQEENKNLKAQLELQEENKNLKAKLESQSQSKSSKSSYDQTKKKEALSSLRAIKSIIDGGATIADFKKYQLEAKIRADSLPNDAESKKIKKISSVYTDAAWLFNICQTLNISSEEVSYFRNKYSDNKEFLKNFWKTSSDSNGYYVGDLQKKLECITAKSSANRLMIIAGEMLDSIEGVEKPKPQNTGLQDTTGHWDGKIITYPEN